MPTTAELLAALPPDVKEPRSIDEKELERIFNAMAGRSMPTGSLSRFCSLGSLSAKLGIAYTAYWVRSWYRPKQAQEKDLLETNMRAAINTLETMSYLRGAIAKAGQLVTCFPESIPKGFVDTLRYLQFQAPPMHFALIREQLLSEIGDPHDVFSEFDETAFAAASIGQVHRARLKTGESVAVKIQYPGIARTIRADLRNLKAMMRPFLYNEDWKAVQTMFEEIQSGLEAETDYEHEAQNIREVRPIFEDEDDIVVPMVFDNLSTRKVLTMEFLEGKSTDEFVASNPSQEDRDRLGTLIWKACFGTYVKKMLYTDAHPGNFIFMDEGRLGFIDFGNVRCYSDAEWEFHCQINDARYGTDEDITAACKRSLMMTDEDATKHPRMLELVQEMFAWYNEPILFKSRFDYGDPDYIKRGVDILVRAAKEKWVKQQPSNAFCHRVNFQIPALLYKLKSRVDVTEVMRGFGKGAK
jgi:predicted unusual protein kinase regulating ubiquinone biosynthesis (AarF/ABC1/UbiB family)